MITVSKMHMNTPRIWAHVNDETVTPRHEQTIVKSGYMTYGIY